jgi:hypothetical protein
MDGEKLERLERAVGRVWKGQRIRLSGKEEGEMLLK